MCFPHTTSTCLAAINLKRQRPRRLCPLQALPSPPGLCSAIEAPLPTRDCVRVLVIMVCRIIVQRRACPWRIISTTLTCVEILAVRSSSASPIPQRKWSYIRVAFVCSIELHSGKAITGYTALYAQQVFKQPNIPLQPYRGLARARAVCLVFGKMARKERPKADNARTLCRGDNTSLQTNHNRNNSAPAGHPA